MRTTLLTFILLFTLTSVSAQWGNRKTIKGSGNIESQERKIEDNFTAVKSCCSMDVRIKKGNERSLRIEADDNILEHVETDFNGRRLTLRMENGYNIQTSQRIKVFITMPTIDGLYASSSSDLICEGSFSGDELDIDVSSSGEIEVDFTGESVEIDGSSSGRIRLSGSADRVKADLSSSSRVEAEKFSAKRLRAEASSSGRITLAVSEEVDADVSSSGKVYYTGSPKKVFSDASSGGKVKKID